MQMPPTNTKRVLIFDSGVGALSVFEEITKLNPDLHCTLALDNELFPYGLQKEEVLIKRVLSCIETLIKECRPDIVVIACNTASTLVLNQLRNQFNVPFVGVVPAIKPAAKKSRTKVIGLLATPATVARDYTQQLIDDFALNCEVIKIGSSELVDLAEKKLRGQAIDLEKLAMILQPFIDRSKVDKKPKLDTLVLACTHFPLLKGDISKMMSLHSKAKTIHIVDSGTAIALRIQSLLSKKQKEMAEQNEPNLQPHEVILSGEDEYISQLNINLSKLGCAPIRVRSF